MRIKRYKLGFSVNRIGQVLIMKHTDKKHLIIDRLEDSFLAQTVTINYRDLYEKANKK